MKNFLIYFCVIVGLKLFSQQPVVPADKGKAPGSVVKKTGSHNTVQNLVTSLKHDTCLDKKFSLVFYVIQDSLFSKTAAGSATDIAARVNFLNTLFKRICVSFEHCKTVIIPNYTYNKWTHNVVDPIVTSTWFVENTINVYLPDEVESSPCQNDYAYMPDSPSVSSPKNVIVLNDTHDHMAHAFGHFFGLQHTFAEIHPTPPALPAPTHWMVVSHEFVDGSNCGINGDGICDTEADPFPWRGPVFNKYHYFCGYNGDVKDGKGAYYTPPFDNYMSFYSSDCRCRFTQEQYNRMAYIIMTKRMYLH